MIDAARCVAIDQQGDIPPGYEAVRCALHTVAAMQHDDCGKRPIAIWLCEKRLKLVARYVLRNLPAFPSRALLKTTKRLSCSLQLDKPWRRCKGVPTKHARAQQKNKGAYA